MTVDSSLYFLAEKGNYQLCATESRLIVNIEKHDAAILVC